MESRSIRVGSLDIPLYELNTVVVGSGAASLNCADRLHQLGQTDIAVVTEKIGGGTSHNTGSDKQTYYKMSLFGKEPDSTYEMAHSLFDGGGMHGDIALVESVGSLQGFFHLASIGVKFPHNHYGGFVGYKTDHDPRQRATSAGPWTSKQMVQCLLAEVQRRRIPIFDEHDCVSLIVDEGRVVGIVALDRQRLDSDSFGLTLFKAENVVFGVGGPGGIYKTSVYPTCHIGAIGLALEAGARAVNLTESQYGLASIKFRWNVSGTYQQVIPRYISTDSGGNDEREFLNEYFPSMGKLADDIFLKGYQWPFDPKKIENLGSSIIDILVYIETAIRKRRVYMDFRRNPCGGNGLDPFRFEDLEPEALSYLQKSNALLGTPIERLEHMNPMAVKLYRQNGIDLHQEALEIAVCAQHNNGGLAGDIWWESNLAHLFPVGEVNGSHGVYRPGGSALNSGQVGSLRAAQKIAYCYRENSVTPDRYSAAATAVTETILERIRVLLSATANGIAVAAYREEFQQRMTQSGSHIRSLDAVDRALADAYKQVASFSRLRLADRSQLPEALSVRHLALAHTAYLQAIATYLKHDGGSRGSYLVMDAAGSRVHGSLDDSWRYKPENPALRDKVLETVISANAEFVSSFVARRPVPEDEFWFENSWNEYLRGDIYARSE